MTPVLFQGRPFWKVGGGGGVIVGPHSNIVDPDKDENDGTSLTLLSPASTYSEPHSDNTSITSGIGAEYAINLF